MSIAMRIGFVLALMTMPASAATVPFVGCPSDGQVGPVPAPDGPPRTVDISSALSARLAYYKPENGDGALGPRGWHCLSLQGSNGSILFIMPKNPPAADLLMVRRGISGPAIQVTERVGDTSGRFDVAQQIYRYFPRYTAFADAVRKEEPVKYQDWPRSPYPADQLIRRDDQSVEYVTPPRTQGLGTASRLLPDAEPIRSLVILTGDTPDMLSAHIRLPERMKPLGDVLVAQLRRDNNPKRK